jgi:4-hydroxybenzoate polyprenyltransferase
VVIYEWPALYRYYAEYASEAPNLSILFYWVGGFAIFAFITTLIREIIKDIEDFEGDIAYGRNTIPVITGIITAKIIAISLIVVMIGMLYAIWHYILNDKITLIYISFTVVIPLLYVICRLITGKGKSDLNQASRLMKIIMITGLFYSVVVKMILEQNLI